MVKLGLLLCLPLALGAQGSNPALAAMDSLAVRVVSAGSADSSAIYRAVTAALRERSVRVQPGPRGTTGTLVILVSSAAMRDRFGNMAGTTYSMLAHAQTLASLQNQAMLVSVWTGALRMGLMPIRDSTSMAKTLEATVAEFYEAYRSARRFRTLYLRKP